MTSSYVPLSVVSSLTGMLQPQTCNECSEVQYSTSTYATPHPTTCARAPAHFNRREAHLPCPATPSVHKTSPTPRLRAPPASPSPPPDCTFVFRVPRNPFHMRAPPSPSFGGARRPRRRRYRCCVGRARAQSVCRRHSPGYVGQGPGAEAGRPLLPPVSGAGRPLRVRRSPPSRRRRASVWCLTCSAGEAVATASARRRRASAAPRWASSRLPRLTLVGMAAELSAVFRAPRTASILLFQITARRRWRPPTTGAATACSGRRGPCRWGQRRRWRR